MLFEINLDLMQEALDNYSVTELVNYLDMDIASIENYKLGRVPLIKIRLKNAIELMKLANSRGVTPITMLSEKEFLERASQLSYLEEGYVFLNQYAYDWSSPAEALMKFKQAVCQKGSYESNIWCEEIVESDFKKMNNI